MSSVTFKFDPDMLDGVMSKLGELNQVDMRAYLKQLADDAELDADANDEVAIGAMVGGILTQLSGDAEAAAAWFAAQVTAVDEGFDQDPLREMHIPALFGAWMRHLVKILHGRGAESNEIRELLITFTMVFAPMISVTVQESP